MNYEQELKKFIEDGGEIEIIPAQEYENKQVVGSISKKIPELLTLDEGRSLYGQRRQHNKDKKIDLSDIDMSLIPDEICKLVMKEENNKEGGQQ